MYASMISRTRIVPDGTSLARKPPFRSSCRCPSKASRSKTSSGAFARAFSVFANTAAWYSRHASAFPKRIFSASAIGVPRMGGAPTSPILRFQSPLSQSDGVRVMKRLTLRSWPPTTWMRLNAIGRTPLRSTWFICSSVRSAAAMSSMSLIAVMRAVIELRHASLAGASGLGTTRGYYEALLLDVRDARGDQDGKPFDDLAAWAFGVAHQGVVVVLAIELLYERIDVVLHDRGMLTRLAHKR